jgi:hypothetical protein
MRKHLLGAAAVVALTAAAAPAFALPTATNLYADNLTAPSGAAWLADNAGGHLWIADHLNGLCRLIPTPTASTDPAPDMVDSPNCVLIGAAGQFAVDTVNVAKRKGEATTTVAGKADSLRFYVYYTDLSTKSVGVTRLIFDRPTGKFLSGLTNRKTINVKATTADTGVEAAALGKNGDLYVAFKRSANIVKVAKPYATTFTTVQAPKVIGDAGKKDVRALAFDNLNNLYLAPNGGASVTGIADPVANACSPTNICGAGDAGFTGVFSPMSLSWDGTALNVGTVTGVMRVTDPAGAATVDTVVPDTAGFQNVSAVAAVKPTAIYFGSDPTAGLTPLAGEIDVGTPY